MGAYRMVGRIPALSVFVLTPGKQTTDVMLSPFIQHSFLLLKTLNPYRRNVHPRRGW
jgi:hypothetical protein